MRSADMPYTVKTCDASETSESVRIVLFRSGCDRPKRPTTLRSRTFGHPADTDQPYCSTIAVMFFAGPCWGPPGGC